MSSATSWAAAADLARHSVIAIFGRRLGILPRTHLAWSRVPQRPKLFDPFDYWWQAHYLDCLLDTYERRLHTVSDGSGAVAADGVAGCGVAGTDVAADQAETARRINDLTAGLFLRNGFRLVNNYYDDMAWCALALQRKLRIAQLAPTQPLAGRLTPMGGRVTSQLLNTLTRELISAHTDALGGGLFWRKDRVFKNSPATGPAALFFARAGHAGDEAASVRATQLVDWLFSALLDNETGLIHDGIKINPQGPALETAKYTYNQGTAIAAALAVGGEVNIGRAADLIAAIDRHMTVETPSGAALITQGTGDAGLFTAILARYLAIAANDARLPDTARDTALTLVVNTAEGLWQGRDQRVQNRPQRIVRQFGRRRPTPAHIAAINATPAQSDQRSAYVFPISPTSAATVDYPPGANLELSPQLQAWMCCEAAHTCYPQGGPEAS